MCSPCPGKQHDERHAGKWSTSRSGNECGASGTGQLSAREAAECSRPAGAGPQEPWSPAAKEMGGNCEGRGFL